jgi:carboxylesterase type B
MHYKEGEKPLFHRAIIESGAATSRAVRPYNAPIHEEQFQDFLRQANVPADTPPEGIFPYLRSLSTDAISAAQTATFDKYDPSLRWAFQPVIDGDIIPRPPLETWKSGRWHKVPIMTGFTRNEGSLYVDKQLDDPALFPKFFAELLPLLSEEDIATIDRIYADPSKHADSPYRETRDKVGSQYRRIEQAYAHYAYVAPVRQTAELASPSTPVYLYQWALEATVLEGARHADNMRYEVCGPQIMAISEGQRTLARTLHGYVTSFILTGDPNAVQTKGIERPAWPRYEVGKPKAVVFGEKDRSLVGGEPGPAAEVLGDSWERDKCEFWWSKVELSQQ